MPTMTRAQMEEILKRKESVVYNGRSIARVEDLPSEEELAAGDAEAETRIALTLDDQIARLQARKAALTRPAPTAAPTTATATATTPAPIAPADADAELAPDADRPDAPRGGLIGPPKGGRK